MSQTRDLHVHLLPQLAEPETLRGGVAVVIDVLRASTTIVQALASGCSAVYPVAEIEEALSLRGEMRGKKTLLGGERSGKPIPGFDLGNSPGEYSSDVCKGASVIFTTTNGTRAFLHATAAERVLLAAITNFSAVCGQLVNETRPIHILCSGFEGQVALEDAFLAGAFVESLLDLDLQLNDGARIALDCFEFHSAVLLEGLKCGRGGMHLLELGYEEDIKAAAQVDRHLIVPELRRDPLRLEVGSFGVVRKRWPRK
jgi:2-phosphosulfolactate phosphatase